MKISDESSERDPRTNPQEKLSVERLEDIIRRYNNLFEMHPEEAEDMFYTHVEQDIKFLLDLIDFLFIILRRDTLKIIPES